MFVDEFMQHLRVIHVDHELADVWIASASGTYPSYSYGGTRLISHNVDDAGALSVLRSLATYESGIKNLLINMALADNAVATLRAKLPRGFEQSEVFGGRCIIRPKTATIEGVLSSPDQPEFVPVATSILAIVGEVLNSERGAIKLTPDFGRFAGVANILLDYTPHVLGIKCEWGGCGGKSSYTVTGILHVIETLRLVTSATRVTLIGAAGSLGAGVLDQLRTVAIRDLVLCDLVYEGEKPPHGSNEQILPAEFGRFTEACLSRGGITVATTIGNELANSRHDAIPAKSVLVLAHNNSLPVGNDGIILARSLAARQIYVIPGQLLTLGGALVARLEWFWRKENAGVPFDKALAHTVVRAVTERCFGRMQAVSENNGQSPYEAMLELVRMAGGSAA